MMIGKNHHPKHDVETLFAGDNIPSAELLFGAIDDGITKEEGDASGQQDKRDATCARQKTDPCLRLCTSPAAQASSRIAASGTR